jgi:hypothetical protein
MPMRVTNLPSENLLSLPYPFEFFDAVLTMRRPRGLPTTFVQVCP